MLQTFSRRRRWWLAVVQVVLLLVTFAVPAAAASDPAPVSGTQLLQILRTYGIVKGDDQGNLNLDKPIKRAEMITIMVRAMGAEQESAFYKGWSNFTDVKGHWAEGNIAYAAIKGLVKGDGNNTVRPEDPITYAEVLTLILRLVAKEPTTGDWPLNVLLASVDLGLLPPGVTAGNVKDSAVRGLVFQSMASAITTIKGATGKTFLQTYVDTTPPTLTLNQIATSTKLGTISISGNVSGAQSVSVSGKPTTIAGSTFSADIDLSFGKNDVVVVATDLAGNTTTTTATVTRVPRIASIDISGPAEVPIGGKAAYTISAKDTDGKATDLQGVTVEVTDGIGNFDIATGMLTAAATAGNGQIKLSAGSVSTSAAVAVLGQSPLATQLYIRTINDGNLVSAGKPTTVQVEVRSQSGELLTKDYGRQVSLSASGLTGVSITPSGANTVAGVAAFTLSSSQTGVVSLTASSANLTSYQRNAEFGTTTYLVLAPDLATVVLGGTSNLAKIHAELRDSNGSLTTNNTDADIVVTIATSGAQAAVPDNTLTILRGAATSTQSGDDAAVQALQVGTISITGQVSSARKYSVQGTTVSVTQPSVGSGSKLQVIAPQSAVDATGSGIGQYTLIVTDANGYTVTSGSYAFQVQVDTSNKESKVAGIPGGSKNLKVWIASTGNNLVSDGIPEGSPGNGNDIVGRTINGTATIYVQYNKPGTVTLTPVLTPDSQNAIAADGTVGTGSSTVYFNVRPGVGMFTNTAAKLKVTVDTGLATDQDSGVAGTGQDVYANVYVTDASGSWIPGINNVAVTLTKTGSASSIQGPGTQTTVDGKARFQIRTGTSAGLDTFQATATSLTPSTSISLQVQAGVPASAPVIVAARGVKGNIPGTENYVAPDDTDLELVLQPQGVSPNFGVVRLYKYGTNTPLYTSGSIDLASPAPTIHALKSLLPVGANLYQVSFNNAAAESPLSGVSTTINNATYLQNVSIGYSRYDALSHKLTVNAAGLSNAAGSVIDPSKFLVRDPSTNKTLSLGGAHWTIDNYYQFTLDLSDPTTPTNVLAAFAKIEDPSWFSGSDVVLEASASWYRTSTGDAAGADTTNNNLLALGGVENAVFDPITNRLTVNGVGLALATLDPAKVSIHPSTGADIPLNATGNSIISRTESQVIFALSDSLANTIRTDGAATINLSAGWLKDPAYGTAVANAPGITGVLIYLDVRITSTSYDQSTHTFTFTGSGFLSATVTPSKFTVTDLGTANSFAPDDVLGGTTTPTWSVVSDSTFTIKLNVAKYTPFEDATMFNGLDIYLTALDGWIVKNGRKTPPIPNLRTRVPQP